MNHFSVNRFLLPLARTFTSSLLPSVKALVEDKAYNEIPDLLAKTYHSTRTANPFSFLSTISESNRTRIVDDVLQAWISVRPQSRVRTAYSFLLNHILQSESSLSLALAVLQHFLRSGSLPHPQCYLTLSSRWLDRVRELGSPSKVFVEMKIIGYLPDCRLCNYVISSLCEVDRIREALEILKGMREAGCPPDVESYGILIAAICDAGRTSAAIDLLNEMVLKEGLMPRQDTIWKVTATLRLSRELRKAAKVIDLLEKQGCAIQFNVYEALVKSCVNLEDFVMAARVLVRMVNKGFIPFINTRQTVIDGLVAAGKSNLAGVVWQRLADIKSEVS